MYNILPNKHIPPNMETFNFIFFTQKKYTNTPIGIRSSPET